MRSAKRPTSWSSSSHSPRSVVAREEEDSMRWGAIGMAPHAIDLLSFPGEGRVVVVAVVVKEEVEEEPLAVLLTVVLETELAIGRG